MLEGVSAQQIYEERLAAVRGRVNRYTNSGDVHDLRDPAGVRDARALLAMAGQARTTYATTRTGGGPGIDAAHAAGLLYFARHVAVGGDEDERAWAEQLLAPVYSRLPHLAGQLHDLERVAAEDAADGGGYLVPAATLADAPLTTIDAAIAAGRRHLRALRPDEDDRPARMNLGEALQQRFTRTCELADLDAALAEVRAVAERTPDGDAARAHRHGTLGDTAGHPLHHDRRVRGPRRRSGGVRRGLGRGPRRS